MLPFTNQDLTFKLNCDDSWRVVCSPARFDENFKQEKMSINACFHPSNTLLQMLVGLNSWWRLFSSQALLNHCRGEVCNN